MQDGPPPQSSGDDRGPGPRRSRGGRGRRGGRGGRGGGGGYDDRGPPPVHMDAPSDASMDPQDGGRRSTLPRHQLINPTPIPGRLRNESEEGLDTLLSELERNPPPMPMGDGDVAPQQRGRDDRGDRGYRGDRGGDRGGDPRGRGDRGGHQGGQSGARGGRPYRESPERREPSEPRAAAQGFQEPAREDRMTSTTPAVRKHETPSDDAFGMGLFDEPVAKPAAPPQAAPARAPAPIAPPPKPAPEADADDGFGAGLL